MPASSLAPMSSRAALLGSLMGARSIFCSRTACFSGEHTAAPSASGAAVDSAAEAVSTGSPSSVEGEEEQPLPTPMAIEPRARKDVHVECRKRVMTGVSFSGREAGDDVQVTL